ncbi:hypothetical protein BVY02_02100 [bacterium J17]|nr:hypothetical protein BVY02_02100 [bacterium J17]
MRLSFTRGIGFLRDGRNICCSAPLNRAEAAQGLGHGVVLKEMFPRSKNPLNFLSYLSFSFAEKE